MNWRHRWYRSLALLLCAIIVGSSIAPQAAHSAERQKLIVDARDTVLLESLRARGAELLVDYGAFSLWHSPTPGPGRQALVPGDFDTIHLRDMEIDTRGNPPVIPAALRQQRVTGSQLWIVQFVGPIRAEWLAELQDLGLQPVTYMPNHAYVVWGHAAALENLAAQVDARVHIQWQGPYHPAYRLAPELRTGGDAPRALTVQYLAGQDSVGRDLAALGALELMAPYTVAGLTSLTVRLSPDLARQVAGWPAVFNIEPYAAPEMLDERQAQVVAGNQSSGAASSPGYLDWLADRGLPSDPARYPAIAIVDSGLDTGDAAAPGHPVFYQRGDPAQASRITELVNCTSDRNSADGDGHGTINAGIVAGYDDGIATGSQDTAGFAYGLGVAPFARLSAVKIFQASGNYDIQGCDFSSEVVVTRSYQTGARISSNSWGSFSNSYNSLARAYDAWTRDADPTQPGDQAMLHVFAAGNNGPFTFGIAAPSTAKNVVTVGATASLRPEISSDGCDVVASDSPDDIALFSSRGPTADKRFKPDLVAPGAHIVGPASQAPGYNGSGICGNNSGDDNRYYPPDQTRYTVSSGTSHSAPAVAGAAALLEHLYRERWVPGTAPSPAMLKALLLHQPRYLTAADGNDTVPGWGQGWGSLSLTPLLDQPPDLLSDQYVHFDASGQIHEVRGTIADPDQPLVVTLVWNDAPGSTSSIATVNNLDLEVTVAGQTYRGNVFDGAFSTPGGAADDRNNVERVVVPATVSGPVQIRIIAANLAGDGLPGQPGQTDQDFALVVSNLHDIAAVAITDSTWSEIAGNGDPVIDPGETIAIDLTLNNRGDRPLTQFVPRLQPRRTQAVVLEGPIAVTAADEQGNQVLRYIVYVSGDHSCGRSLVFDHAMYADTDILFSTSVAFSTGQPEAPLIFFSDPGPVPISAASDDYVALPLYIDSDGIITDVNVRVDLEHSWVGDLAIDLATPSRNRITLFEFPGNGTERGDNLTGTVFDDEGSDGSIISATPPYSGRFRPVEPLNRLDGTSFRGFWLLEVYDERPSDGGSLIGWAIEIQTDASVCTYGELHTYLPLVSN